MNNLFAACEDLYNAGALRKDFFYDDFLINYRSNEVDRAIFLVRDMAKPDCDYFYVVKHYSEPPHKEYEIIVPESGE